jgi:hypothetical protein
MLNCSWLAEIHHQENDTARNTDRGRALTSRRDHQACWLLHALRGQSDEATRWLERAFTQRDANLMMIKVDTALVPLNGDPRFKALLRKMNLPE